MTEYCPYCGLILDETTWKRKFCKNCGIIDEEKEEKESDERPSYV